MALNNYENTIRAYITTRLQEEFPELVGVNSTQDDLFVNPLIELLKPIIESSTRAELMQDLGNAALMTEDELDIIGVNNYGVTRLPGGRSSGYVFIEMDAAYVGPGIVVIGPIMVSTNDGLRFNSGGNTIIRINDTDDVSVAGTIVPGIAADYLNSSTGKYEFPIYVTAEAEGTYYNVDAREVSQLITEYPLLTGIVFNRDAFISGADKESNTSYAARITNSFFTRSSGTSKGYESWILDKYPAVKAVYVAGMGDVDMLRDKAIIRVNGTTTEASLGGKVDIFIRGNSIAVDEQYAYLNSDKIILAHDRLVGNDDIEVSNLSNPNNDPTITVVSGDMTYGQVVAGPSGVLPRTGDELQIRYVAYVDSALTDTMVYTQRLIYKTPGVYANNQPVRGITKVETGAGTDVTDQLGLVGIRVSPIIETGTLPSQTGITAPNVKLNPAAAVNIPDYYVGGMFQLTSIGSSSEAAEIVAYDVATGVITLASSLGAASGNTYSIRGGMGTPVGTENSVRDSIVFIPSDPGTAPTPDYLVKITYTYNKLVSDIQDDLDFNEHRIITTDTLIREAVPVYVYFMANIVPKRGRSIGQAEQLAVRLFFEQLFEATSFNSSLQFSDIIGLMYKDNSLMSFIEYIKPIPMVFTASTVPWSNGMIEDAKETLSGTTSDSDIAKAIIEFTGAQYPVIGEIWVPFTMGGW